MKDRPYTLEEYPFSAKFQCHASVVTPNDRDVHMAKASLNSLKGLLPKDVNPADNPDFLYFAANGCQISKANLNSDCLDMDTGLRIYSHRFGYIGTDHEKNVVGVILYPGLSEYGTSELIDEAKARELGVCNISLAGVVWRAIDPELVNLLIESTDPTSPKYAVCSLSWEVFFKSYEIAVGSGLLKEDRIVTDEAEIEKLSLLLPCNGGSGKLGKDRVYRVISGPDVIIAGYSWVVNPAASVRGLTLLDSKDEKTIEIEDKSLSPKSEDDKNKVLADAPEIVIDAILPDNAKKDDNNAEIFTNTSLSQINDVNLNITNNTMKEFNSVQDIVSNLADFAKLDSAVAGSWVSKMIDSGIRAASTEYSSKLNEKETAVANAQAAAVQAQADAAKASQAAEVLAGELKALKDKITATEKEGKFQSRMAELDADYDMSDEDKSCVAGDIKDLDTGDASWASFKKKFSVLAREKSKAYKAEMKAKADKLAKEGHQDKSDKGADNDDAVKAAAAALALDNAKLLEDKQTKITAGLTADKESLLKTYKSVFSPEKLLKAK